MFEIGNSLREARLRQGLDFPELEPDEIPMFWGQAAGPQTRDAIKESQLPLMITHKGGHMFISDKLTAELAGQ